jgi:putative SOS response-associated peptidase YedK
MLRRSDTGGLDLVMARWGLIPFWWKDAKPPRLTFNARSEEAASKPMWRVPVSKSRCLVPALGWYEWQEVERVSPETGEIQKVKQPYFIRLPGGGPFTFAGLMARWTPEGAGPMVSCSIITKEAEGPAAEVHSRMPLVLPRDTEGAWLDSAQTDCEGGACGRAGARRDRTGALRGEHSGKQREEPRRELDCASRDACLAQYRRHCFCEADSACVTRSKHAKSAAADITTLTLIHINELFEIGRTTTVS